MKTWWRDLSVSKKLYVVVGIMALLVTTELFTLLFAMDALSASRAFVGGEGLWSKAQKNAVHNLEKYAISRDEKFYQEFLENLKIPLGDRQARMEMANPNMNMQIVVQGFVAGGNHPDDVPGMIKLIQRFYKVPQIAEALEYWRKADDLMMKLIDVSTTLRTQIDAGKNYQSKEIQASLDEIYVLNNKLTVVENGFSASLGEASRVLENILRLILIFAVFCVEGTGVLLTIVVSRKLNKTLIELNDGAVQVGKGDFNKVFPVQSKDELGQLALSLNNMTSNLRKQINERQAAEHASQAKNLFLANMSHEIRTPLNAILGFSELLQDPNLSEQDKQHYLDIVRRTGSNLTTIINDILDISKVEAEHVEIEMASFSLPALLKDLSLLLEMRCKQKGLLLEFHAKGEISTFIFSDSLRLRQILLNIIGNAIKFTEQGSVVVTYQVVNKQLVFTVTDSGAGISPEQAERLFKPFSQGDDSVRKKYGGTGLGLILSQRLAQLMGGDVGLLQSEAGRGSTFFVKVAYSPATQQEVDLLSQTEQDQTLKAAAEKLRNKKILVVEDTIENQLLIRLYLEKLGIEVDLANNGLDGVEKVLSQDYDAVLMDMQMPIKDGYEATQELRAKGKTLPIIALTGYAMKGDREKCIAVGCSDYFSKPIDRNKLIHVIAKYF